jgi:hypothetical protein
VLSTYIFGPFVTMLPRRWRAKPLATVSIQLSRASMLSGIVEAALAIVSLTVWYSIYVTLLSSAAAHSSVAVPEQSANRIGMFAYVWFWLNPITWVVAYFVLEGAMRFLAGLVTGEAYAILPLWALERSLRFVEQRNARPALPLVADEITPGDASCDMKIASCREKSNWKYPFTIRFAGSYFQVVGSVNLDAGPRPHVYSLRRLPPGEVAGGLKNYDPADILTAVAPLEPIEK